MQGPKRRREPQMRTNCERTAASRCHPRQLERSAIAAKPTRLSFWDPQAARPRRDALARLALVPRRRRKCRRLWRGDRDGLRPPSLRPPASAPPTSSHLTGSGAGSQLQTLRVSRPGRAGRLRLPTRVLALRLRVATRARNASNGASRTRTGDLLGAITTNAPWPVSLRLVCARCGPPSSVTFSQFGRTISRTVSAATAASPTLAMHAGGVGFEPTAPREGRAPARLQRDGTRLVHPQGARPWHGRKYVGRVEGRGSKFLPSTTESARTSPGTSSRPLAA